MGLNTVKEGLREAIGYAKHFIDSDLNIIADPNYLGNREENVYSVTRMRALIARLENSIKMADDFERKYWGKTTEEKYEDDLCSFQEGKTV